MGGHPRLDRPRRGARGPPGGATPTARRSRRRAARCHPDGSRPGAWCGRGGDRGRASFRGARHGEHFANTARLSTLGRACPDTVAAERDAPAAPNGCGGDAVRRRGEARCSPGRGSRTDRGAAAGEGPRRAHLAGTDPAWTRAASPAHGRGRCGTPREPDDLVAHASAGPDRRFRPRRSPESPARCRGRAVRDRRGSASGRSAKRSRPRDRPGPIPRPGLRAGTRAAHGPPAAVPE